MDTTTPGSAWHSPPLEVGSTHCTTVKHEEQMDCTSEEPSEASKVQPRAAKQQAPTKTTANSASTSISESSSPFSEGLELEACDKKGIWFGLLVKLKTNFFPLFAGPLRVLLKLMARELKFISKAGMTDTTNGSIQFQNPID